MGRLHSYNAYQLRCKNLNNTIWNLYLTITKNNKNNKQEDFILVMQGQVSI